MLQKFWKKLSNFGVDKSLTIIATRKAILTNQLSFITFFVVFSMNASFLFLKEFEFDPAGFISSFIILTTPLLNKKGHYKTAAFIFVVLMPISLMLFSSVNKTLLPQPLPFSGYILPKVFLLSFLVLPLVLIDSRSKILLVTSVLINLFCFFFIDKLNELMGVGLDFNNISFENYSNINMLMIFPIAILIFGFSFLNNINNKSEDQILKQNKKLEKANIKIERFNKDLTDSIQYAKRIQNALLPEKDKLRNFFADSFVFYKPRNIVSGDFYFLKETKINNESCVIVAAADCTGHGVPGGFMSVLSMSLLNDIIVSNSFNNAGDILNQLRNKIKSSLNQTGKPLEQRDGLEMSLIIYQPNNKTISFSGAKNPLFIINQTGELTIHKGDRMPIGYHHIEKPFSTKEIILNGNEMCYLFTDGMIDQMNKKGNRLMTKNLKKWLNYSHNYSCLNQHKEIIHNMYKWMLKDNYELTEQVDDMLLLGLKIKP